MKLVNDEGQIIDSLTYDDSLPWPVDANGGGATLELIDAHSNNSLPENWEASLNHGTPGKLNSVLTSAEKNDYTNVSPEFYLHQNYPNPFNSITVISYRLAVGSKVTLKIFNVLGREVAALVNEEKPAGTYTIYFDAGNLPDGKAGLSSGVYFYQLKVNNPETSLPAGKAGSGQVFMDTKKFILLK